MRRALHLLFVIAAVMSCSDNGGDGGIDDSPDAAAIEFDFSALLANVGENVVLPVYETFDANASALVTAVSAYCDALGQPDETAMLAASQTAWSTAIDTWQQAEVMIIGPASADGDSLRDSIYSWPIVSACAVDGDVMLVHDDAAGYDITTRLPNRRGLDSLEYVLFSTSLDSVCTPAQQPAGWDALSDSERRAARCAYASLAAADVALQAGALVDAWRSDRGNFIADLASAGESTSSFPTLDGGLNAVFAALFYVDTKTKDAKLGKPAGVSTNVCATQGQACPEALESQFAHRSKQHVAANLRGFEMLFFGNHPDGDQGIGFDDYLRAVERDDLADQFALEVSDARDAVVALQGTLVDLLGSDYESVVGAHAAVRDVTTLLKQDAPGALGLQIPDEAGGDTD